MRDLERHYMFVSEYAYAFLEKDDPGGRMVNVYDLSKLTFGALFGPSCELAVSSAATVLRVSIRIHPST